MLRRFRSSSQSSARSTRNTCSIASKPGEAALHNPGEARDLERALPAFDDLQLPAVLAQQVRASSALWCPASAMTVRMFGNNGLRPPSNRAAAFRSEMSAGSTLHVISSPKVSTRMWRLRPLTRLCASNNAAAFCCFHRLAIHDDDRRTGGPAGLPSGLAGTLSAG